MSDIEMRDDDMKHKRNIIGEVFFNFALLELNIVL